MTVETNPTTIADLNAASPAATDPRFEGAAHIRNIKAVLKDTFPNLKGSIAVSDTAWNAIAGQFSEDGKTFSPGTPYLVPSPSDTSKNYAIGVSDADARYLSRVAQLGPTDIPAISLFYSVGFGGPWFVSSAWTGQLAKQTDLVSVKDTASSGVGIGQAAQSSANAAQSSANAAQASANSAISQAQGAQNSANSALDGINSLNTTKLAAVDGTATRLVIEYGSAHAQFQSDGNFVMYQGSGAYFSVSPETISWNGHGLVFQDANVLPSGRRIEAFSAQTTDGSRVNFPQGFSSDANIIIQLTALRSNGRVVIASWENVDAGGFTIGLQREDTNGASQQTSSWSVHVTAIGNA